MIIAQIHQAFLNAESLSTDTRTILPGAMYFALSGENFNGNQYAQQALDKGADYVVIDDQHVYNKDDKRMLLVEDTLKTLQELASYHRNYLGLPIIALTGSNGKTTTKNLISQVLSEQFNIQATKGNLNNHIGVPLTILSMTEEHDLGLVEMGANHPGEIDLLCQIAQPNYGYITNFGKAHLQGFGSLEGVVSAKTELYRYLASNDGLVFVYVNDSVQMKLSESLNRILFESGDSDQLDFQMLNAQPKLQFRYKANKLTTNLVGAYNFVNCIAAMAIGAYFGVTEKKLIKAISSYTSDNNRSQIIKTNKNLLLLDAYNANPTSVRAAVDSFIVEKEHSNKVLILGDMLELGDFAADEHQAVVDSLVGHVSVRVFLVGENFNRIEISSPHISIYKNRDDLEIILKEQPIKDSYILLKGSRGIALEKLVDYL